MFHLVPRVKSVIQAMRGAVITSKERARAVKKRRKARLAPRDT